MIEVSHSTRLLFCRYWRYSSFSFNVGDFTSCTILKRRMISLSIQSGIFEAHIMMTSFWRLSIETSNWLTILLFSVIAEESFVQFLVIHKESNSSKKRIFHFKENETSSNIFWIFLALFHICESIVCDVFTIAVSIQRTFQRFFANVVFQFHDFHRRRILFLIGTLWKDSCSLYFISETIFSISFFSLSVVNMVHTGEIKKRTTFSFCTDLFWRNDIRSFMNSTDRTSMLLHKLLSYSFTSTLQQEHITFTIILLQSQKLLVLHTRRSRIVLIQKQSDSDWKVRTFFSSFRTVRKTL